MVICGSGFLVDVSIMLHAGYIVQLISHMKTANVCATVQLYA